MRDHKGAPYSDDATRYLKASIDLAVTLAAKQAVNQAALDNLRAQQRVGDAKCNDLVGQLRDMLFNRVGRPGNDPVFNQIFPAGIGSYTSVAPTRKHLSLELLAGLVENTTHPLIPKELAASVAAELRAAAAPLKVVNDQLQPARAEAVLLQAQRTASARQSQIQLARLKKYWRSTGMSESDIHAILPDRPVTAPAAAAKAVGAAASTPTLSVVPSMAEEELPPEPGEETRDEEVVAAK